MNKLYSQIASLIVIVGLGTAWSFKLLTFEQLGTGAAALLGLIYGLYQKYEQGVLQIKSLKLEDELETSNKNVTHYKTLYKSEISTNKDLLNNIKILNQDKEVVSEVLEVQVPAETEAP